MDLTIKQSNHHKLKRTLMVKLHRLQKELKLAVQIDKSLVHLPEKEPFIYEKQFKKQKTKEEDKVCKHPERKSNPSHVYCGTFSSQPVDATLLINLAEYACIPPVTKGPGSATDKCHEAGHLSASVTDSSSSDVTNLCPNWSEEKQSNLNCDKCLETPSSQVRREKRGEDFKYSPVHNPGYLSNMENEISDHRPIRSETVDLCSTGKMILTSNVSNNVQLKPEELDTLCESNMKTERQSTIGLDLSVRLNKKYNYNVESTEVSKQNLSPEKRILNVNDMAVGRERDSNHDQMVPQVPMKELTHCQAIPKGWNDSSDPDMRENNSLQQVEETKISKLQDTSALPNGFSQKKVEGEITKDTSVEFHGHDSLPGGLSGELQEGTPPASEQSEGTIGQRVDEEIKALLEGSNLRNGAYSQEHDNKEETEIEDNETNVFLKDGSEPSLEQPSEGGSTKAVESAVEGYRENVQDGGCLNRDGDAANDGQGSVVPPDDSGEGGRVDKGHGKEGNHPQCQESERHDMHTSSRTEERVSGESHIDLSCHRELKESPSTTDGDKHEHSEDQLNLQIAKENGKTAEGGNVLDRSCINTQDENDTLKNEHMSHQQNYDSSLNSSEYQHHHTLTSANQPYQSNVWSDENEEAPSETSEEYKVGRKGLKQQQSQSLLEAEITSEQTEFIPTTDIPSTLSKCSHKLSANEFRSHSVIVSNPRSASGAEGRHPEDESHPCGNSDEADAQEAPGNDDREVNQQSAAQKIHPGTASDHPELFQALTPPPPSVSMKGSQHIPQTCAEVIERSPCTNLQVLRHPSIQISSIRTLASLTNGGLTQPMSSSVRGTLPIHVPPGHLIMNRSPHPDSLLGHQEIMKHSVILQGPPVSSLQPPEGFIRVSNVSPKEIPPNHIHLLDLSKEGGKLLELPMSEERDLLMAAMHRAHPRTSSSGGQLVADMHESRMPPVQAMVIKEEKKPSLDYNHEEQQQHFMEIKRHLLTSKANITPKELSPMPRMVPVSMNGLNPRPVISVAPVTKQEILSAASEDNGANDSKPTSPIGKFSGAMMEHVRHWKEQNELNNQTQNVPATAKVPPSLIAVDASGHPMVYPPMVPSHPVAPPVAVDRPTNLNESEEGFETPSDINHGLLENLQALHKMYFKTMQGTDKVIFPKMPPKIPGTVMPGPMHEMVQVVKPFMPPPIQPQMIPRFPPEGHIPPELMNYHMNVVARNIPAPLAITPSTRNAFQPQMIPSALISDRHQLHFADINGRFPRPPFPLSHMEHAPKNMHGNGEIIMVPPSPSSQFLMSPQLHLPGKSQSLPRDLMNPGIMTTVGPHGVPMMLLPPGTKYLTEKGIVVSEPVVSRPPVEPVSSSAKRKPEDGAPLDLSTTASKVRRVNSCEDLPSGEQPIDLSVKGSPLKDVPIKMNSMSLPMSIADGKPMPLSNFITYAGFPPVQHMGLVSRNQSPPTSYPQRFLGPPRFLSPHGPGGLQNIHALLPQRMPHPGMGVGKPHLVSPPANSSLPRLPLIDSQQRLPTIGDRLQSPDQIEMMKLISGNTSQFIPHTLLPTSRHAAVISNNFTEQHLAHPAANSIPLSEAEQSLSEANLDLAVKRKRGRPKGSTNKRRFQPVIPPLQIIETASSPVPAPVCIPSEIAECQFCDFKAASRGDVRQHVKVVHFAKFRRSSSKSAGSCDALTPTSEYSSPIEQQLPLSSQGDKVGEWTTVAESGETHNLVTVSQVSPRHRSVSPDMTSASEGSCLVIDVSAAATNRINEEGHTAQGYSRLLPSDFTQGNSSRSTEQSDQRDTDHGDRQGKPPLKITLRRISAANPAVGERTLPQEKTPPDKKPKFICQTCGASYNYVNGLREHESRHKVDLPFECGVCHLKYKTQGMLSRHQAQKNHHVAP